jgi:hypothetical protein
VSRQVQSWEVLDLGTALCPGTGFCGCCRELPSCGTAITCLDECVRSLSGVTTKRVYCVSALIGDHQLVDGMFLVPSSISDMLDTLD